MTRATSTPLRNRLDGKVAVITGAGGGIGSETARRMVAEGASVVLGDVNADTLEAVAAETGGVAVRTDVTLEDEVRALVDTALKQFGRIDILHNNAVMHVPGDSDIVGTTDEAWNSTFNIVILANAYACRAAIPSMIENGGGAIINTSSGAAQIASDRIAYGSCKAALEAVTLYTAAKFALAGIRTNAVAPGPILTEGMRRGYGEQLAAFSERNTSGRMGTPGDIADAVVFLASDEAAYINGQVIAVNGGGLRTMQ